MAPVKDHPAVLLLGCGLALQRKSGNLSIVAL